MLQNIYQWDNGDIFGTIEDLVEYIRLKNILGWWKLSDLSDGKWKAEIPQ